MPLATPLSLPCGAVLPNRLAKAAMTEGLADPAGRPTPALDRLYRTWSHGGAGLLLSGNIQIDAGHLERPGNVIIDRAPDAAMAAALTRWAAAATVGGNHFWAQISHAGRQTQKKVNPTPKAPSAVRLGLPGGQFGTPVAMTVEDIDRVRRGFVTAAQACRAAGFTGIQIHAAHGYLLSQFLSPRSNQRSDDYGGNLEGRARLLLDSVQAVRAAVGPDFPIAVKLNSADFQRGGFAFNDSLTVAGWLEAAGIDLLEISGGTYEQPKLLGMEGIEPEEPQAIAESTLAREAYFVDFAKAIKAAVTIPVMVTGGLRRRAAMESVLDQQGADLIGLARPLCTDPAGPNKLLAGAENLDRWEDRLSLLPGWLKFLEGIGTVKTIAAFAKQYWFYAQIYAIGHTAEPALAKSVGAALIEVQKTEAAWLRQRQATHS